MFILAFILLDRTDWRHVVLIKESSCICWLYCIYTPRKKHHSAPRRPPVALFPSKFIRPSCMVLFCCRVYSGRGRHTTRRGLTTIRVTSGTSNGENRNAAQEFITPLLKSRSETIQQRVAKFCCSIRHKYKVFSNIQAPKLTHQEQILKPCTVRTTEENLRRFASGRQYILPLDWSPSPANGWGSIMSKISLCTSANRSDADREFPGSPFPYGPS